MTTGMVHWKSIYLTCRSQIWKDLTHVFGSRCEADVNATFFELTLTKAWHQLCYAEKLSLLNGLESWTNVFDRNLQAYVMRISWIGFLISVYTKHFFGVFFQKRVYNNQMKNELEIWYCLPKTSTSQRSL